ncbi:hypothetical protein GLOIN_2v1784798 [Rhizophagus irregularis DAOM 181602=DAOM 197198]|uniref:DUF8211 domain-containing protein n=2 Tax=Rhizophagus irregularis TaxID=588596 RepID=A0A2P4PBV9_RHIID|nr:hypothetical protein GLOIN_2v1784798 [Rhizophagus irregularis DAOM 181602=DAOM 197198]POG62847.1 hypothetical protein GLOIN_2v1784798 [Rhizophagus irregularis DAOM 181602=DAOM 197198]|eukprot:XP_025169713.1 hypothetical protein GLOIN_2v1784798 [Rhizophagus irregularis DAOM 181602=DAOM 197198]
MSSFIRIDDYESYEKLNNGFTTLNQHSNKRVPDKVSAPNDIISHVPSTPFCTSTSKIPSTHISSSHSPIYEIRRSRSYFFELDDLPPNTNDLHFKIYTNDYHMKILPRKIQQKFFPFIRDRLLARKEMISSRANSSRERNTTMRTFFNFTYKKYRFYFGIYIPCSQQQSLSPFYPLCEECHVPSPFVMSHCRRHQAITSTTIVLANNKGSHANLLHDRWNCRKKKAIISQRLGISYKESYLARTKGSVIHHANKHMYRKRLDTFSITQKHNRLDTMRHRLITAQRYRFLFLPSQYIYKPIKHLQYTHGIDYPDYGFKIPYNQDAFNIPIHTVEPYNPTLSGFFPSKYKDIIPKEPIYTATGDFIIPGSREWFTHMYRLDCARKAAPPSPVLSLDERRNLLQKEADHIGDSIIEKEKQAEDNSKFQLRLHQEMTAFNDTFNLGKRIAVVTPETKDELYIPYQYGGFYIDNPSQEDSKCVTSDDSKEIERRPYKRLTTSQFAPLPVNNHIDRLKRRRNIPADTVDSSEAGPSGSSTNN